MALNDLELLQSYRLLHQLFPEDMHIARPFIHMLQHHESDAIASEMALAMARRMLANGRTSHAISFLALCKQLNHPQRDEIDSLTDLARLSMCDSAHDTSQSFALIEQLSDSEGVSFIQQGKLLQIQHHDLIVSQGENSKTFYLILDGSVDVQINVDDGHSITVQTLNAGNFFGEFACLYHLPRSANVIAQQETLLLELSDSSIEQLIQTSSLAGDYLIRTVQHRMVDAMTHSLPAFANLPEADRIWAVEEATVHEYAPGDAIASTNPTQPECHIMLAGSARMQRADGSSMTFTSGMMFGDVSPHIRLPAHTRLEAAEHTLLCSIPEHIFHTFMNVYADFEQYVQGMSASRNTSTA